LRKGIITAENFGALMISYSEIGGHVLAPFLDTYPGSVGRESARQGNSHRSAGKLPMEVVTDGESADDMGGRLEDGWLDRGGVLVCHGRIVLCFP